MHETSCSGGGASCRRVGRWSCDSCGVARPRRVVEREPDQRDRGARCRARHRRARMSACCRTTFGRRIIMQRTSVALSLTAALVTIASTARSQTSIALDSIITRIAVEAQERSQLYPLAQTLMDSIGPRLAGSIEQRRANEWVLGTYRRWGIPVREERYGTWNEWRREIAHIDLIAPRKRPLEGMLSTWSQGTNGTIEASLVVQPAVLDAPELEAWLPQVRGKLVLLDFPWPSCRPDSELKERMSPESFARMQS